MLRSEMVARALVALCLAAFAVEGSAASIAGQVRTTGGVGIAGYKVLLYGQTAKGWAPVSELITNGLGDYTFNAVPVGNYIVRAVPGDLTTQCRRGRRYYDAAAPVAGGRLQSAADVLTIHSSGTNLTGISFSIPMVGSLEGRVLHAGNGVDGMIVRVEVRSEPQDFLETVTVTNGGVAGSFSACSLEPGSHRIRIHAPDSQFEDALFLGPYTVVANAGSAIGNLSVSPIGSDPDEPNDSAAAGTLLPPIVDAWTSTNAIITPRAGDLDFHCFIALAGDRYLITTDTSSLVDGVPTPSPWMDAQLGWFSRSPMQVLAVNDDDPFSPGSLDSRIVTEPVASDGIHCVGVTTFGDPDFTATGQASAGRYQLRIALVPDSLFADGFD